MWAVGAVGCADLCCPFFAGETQDRRGHERGDGEDEARKRIEFKSVLHLICFVFHPEFRRQVLEDARSRARQVIDDGEYTVRRQVQKEKLGLTDWYRLVQIGMVHHMVHA
jgi:hypothetical protein